MIDKYKRPRVQRLVPWRNQLTRSNDPNNWAHEMARSIIGRQRSCKLANDSCALPGEYQPWELRSDWQ